jgi:ketosteroid isomerase-like protein
MKTKRVSCALLFALWAVSTAVRADGLRAEMEAANAEWLTAFNTLNGGAFAALYTKDAVVLPPNVQPIVGAEAIGQYWTDRIKGGNLKNHSFEITSTYRDGKYAYQVARWTLDVINDKGETTKRAGNTVRIFEKQPNGKWLTKVHIYNYPTDSH